MKNAEIFDEIKQIAHFVHQKGWAERNAGNLSFRIDDAIYITTSGSKFRDIASQPGKYLIRSNEGTSTQTPSTELPTHALIHAYLSEHAPEKKCVMHTHPTHLIALSHKFYHYTPQMINTLLESIMPEVAIFIPRQTGFVELLTPGSTELAEQTLSNLSYHDVIVWKKHGCIAVADTFWDAVDMIDILDKAAYIALLAGLK